MQILANSLRRTPIFAHLNCQQITTLIKRSKLYTVSPGTIITAPANAVKHHLLILDGNIKSQNKWLFHGNEMQYCWQLQSDESLCHFAILSSATRAMNATATSSTRYLFINGDEVENLHPTNLPDSQQSGEKVNTSSQQIIKTSPLSYHR